MTGYVITAQGVTTILPAPVSWCFQYTSGVPCDSFRLRCIWDGDNQVRPEEWALFQALEGGEVQFTGVVDECETVLGPEGAFFEVSGRGMAARLLDNEALSQDYELAAPADILRDHVEPYGIQTEGGAALGPVSRFSVAAGSSEWAVLYEFARYHNGICPRFDREGRLILSPWPDTREIALDDAVPVERLSCRVRRYGVLSQVVVRDRYQNRTETVENPAFQALGGHRRQVVTMPGKSQYQAMRYSGRFQLERSAAEQLWIQAEIPMLFFAQPGDLVRLERSNWGRNGRYRVMEAQVGQDESGGWTRLELAPPDVILRGARYVDIQSKDGGPVGGSCGRSGPGDPGGRPRRRLSGGRTALGGGMRPRRLPVAAENGRQGACGQGGGPEGDPMSGRSAPAGDPGEGGASGGRSGADHRGQRADGSEREGRGAGRKGDGPEGQGDRQWRAAGGPCPAHCGRCGVLHAGIRRSGWS